MNLEQLRQTPTAELVSAHDELARNTMVGVDYYLRELARRDAAAQTEQMLRLTWVVAIFAAVAALATIASVILVIVT